MHSPWPSPRSARCSSPPQRAPPRPGSRWSRIAPRVAWSDCRWTRSSCGLSDAADTALTPRLGGSHSNSAMAEHLVGKKREKHTGQLAERMSLYYYHGHIQWTVTTTVGRVQSNIYIEIRLQTCWVSTVKVHEHSGVGIKAGEVCAVQPCSVRVKHLSKAQALVLQAARQGHRHRHWHRRWRPEVPRFQTESPLEIFIRWEVHHRGLVSQLRRKDALDAEVRHSASVHRQCKIHKCSESTPSGLWAPTFLQGPVLNRNRNRGCPHTPGGSLIC